ncbi:hypothetical protein [Sinorhizobium meliloti]|uniref:hypothetical protein n=1 Tax=Rhizobium meliloti TaxID=382 RepID=UPI0012A94B70|nr:hypothetical protein [Sinorhizobium meliloti]QGJ74066.1 hypothetical protein C3L21_08600 [Sinorhizobium meliloti]
MKVWIMHGMTESGDDVGPYAFASEPTVDEQIAILKRDLPCEFEDAEDLGPFGYISELTVEPVEVIA